MLFAIAAGHLGQLRALSANTHAGRKKRVAQEEKGRVYTKDSAEEPS
jgi:hypothetical protein